MKKLVAIILFLSLPWGAFGASISGVSGTVADGESITISGADFGTGPTVVLFDDFELGTNGSNIRTGTGSAQVGTWTANNTTKTYYTNTTSVSGNLAFQANATIDWFSYIETSLGGATTKVFLSWWIFIPSGNNLPGYNSNRVNWKQMWVMGSGTTDDDLVIPLALNASAPNTIASWLINGNDALGYANYTTVSFTLGTWKRLACYLSGSSSGAGIVKFWDLTSTGLVQRENVSNASFLGADGAYERVRPNGYAATAANCYPTFDDIYIAKGDYAQARVEIGSNSTYSTCTNLAVVTPTSWGASSITGVVRQGSFPAGQTAYLYVTDSTGSTSSGYPITIGGTTIDSTAPAASGYSPAKSATSVPINTDISATISDAGTGVDVDTVRMSIEGATHCCTSMVGTCPNTGTKDLTCSGTASSIAVTKGSNTFSNAQTVDIILNASDIQGNAMSADSYSFQTSAGGADATAPVVAITSPTTLAYFYTDDSATTFGGTATDNVGLASPAVAWANSQGGSGNAAGSATWTVDVLPLSPSTFGSTIITNGTFPTDYASWTPNNATVTHGTFANRENCISIADNGAWSEVSQVLTVEDGELYLVTARVYSLNNDWAENGSILVDHAGARTNTWGNEQIMGPAVPNAWTQIAGVVRAVGTSMVIRLHSEDAYTAYFDDIVVKKVTAANVITVTGTDSSANTGTDQLTIVYNPPTPAASSPNRVIVHDAAGKVWQYDANGVRLVTE